MKNIKSYKKFKESAEQMGTTELMKIYNTLKKQYISCEFTLDRNLPTVIEFSIDCCNIEPEEGQYVPKSEFFIKVGQKLENFTVDLTGISGSYGCDEPEEDDDVEPELDYTIEATDIDVKDQFRSSQEAIDFIIKTINEYI